MNTDEPVLEAIRLRKHYAVGGGPFRATATLRAVDGVSFTLRAGRTLAVVGESGSGKSTLARVVVMAEQPTAGSLLYGGTDVTTMDRRAFKALRPTVQMVFQNPLGALNPRMTVASILGEPLAINTDLGRAERRARALAMMERVGLRADQIDRHPHMFSGGQRQRIAIARALMTEPAVVVADEPVSALDISIQAQVLNLMMDLRDALGVAYLFISHDLAVVRHVADEVMVMYLGRPVEHGPAAAVFAEPLHPYTRALLAAAPRVGRDGRALPSEPPPPGETPSPLAPPRGCAYHGRCPEATPACAEVEPPSRTVADGRRVACHLVAGREDDRHGL